MSITSPRPNSSEPEARKIAWDVLMRAADATMRSHSRTPGDIRTTIARVRQAADLAERVLAETFGEASDHA